MIAVDAIAFALLFFGGLIFFILRHERRYQASKKKAEELLKKEPTAVIQIALMDGKVLDHEVRASIWYNPMEGAWEVDSAQDIAINCLERIARNGIMYKGTSYPTHMIKYARVRTEEERAQGVRGSHRG